MLRLRSTNPALAGDTFQQFSDSLPANHEKADEASIQGVINKTTILVILAVISGSIGYWALGQAGSSLLWIGNIIGIIATLGIYFVISARPNLARALAPVYAVIQGFLLGMFSSLLQNILVSQGVAVPGGIALQAFIITVCIMLAMLALYTFGGIRPNRLFVSVLSVATLGIFLIYMVSFVLGFFGIQLPFIHLGSAMEGGSAAWIGLGINILILGIASLWLIVDFQLVERVVTDRSPRSMEWYCAFALVVSLVWVYLEALKLVFRVALLFNNRD